MGDIKIPSGIGITSGRSRTAGPNLSNLSRTEGSPYEGLHELLQDAVGGTWENDGYVIYSDEPSEEGPKTHVGTMETLFTALLVSEMHNALPTILRELEEAQKYERLGELLRRAVHRLLDAPTSVNSHGEWVMVDVLKGEKKSWKDALRDVLDEYVRAQEPVADWRDAILAAARERMRFIMKNRDQLVEAFIAKTGFSPEECEIVERHGANGEVLITVRRSTMPEGTL